MELREQDVADWLNALSDKQLVEFFYKHLSERHLCPEEKAHVDNHLVIANASRVLDDDDVWSAWEVQLLCPTPGQRWVDDAPVCQYGRHCGNGTASWAKNSVCPVCGGPVYGS